MDRDELRGIFERLDAALRKNTLLLLRGGAAVLSLGLEGRVTSDIDVLPGSRFVDVDLRQACAAAGIAFNPDDKEWSERDYLELVPEETLALPVPSAERPYNTVFRGERLTVQVAPAADLVVGKLKRLDPEDLGDVVFLIRRVGLTPVDIQEAFGRLPPRFRADPVVQDNLRYILEDCF